MADQEDPKKKELRKQIQTIQADKSLSATEKAKQIQVRDLWRSMCLDIA